MRSGTNRLDSHIGLQEAFAEVKLHDLGSNYDFVVMPDGSKFSWIETDPGTILSAEAVRFKE